MDMQLTINDGNNTIFSQEGNIDITSIFKEIFSNSPELTKIVSKKLESILSSIKINNKEIEKTINTELADSFSTSKTFKSDLQKTIKSNIEKALSAISIDDKSINNNISSLFSFDKDFNTDFQDLFKKKAEKIFEKISINSKEIEKNITEAFSIKDIIKNNTNLINLDDNIETDDKASQKTLSEKSDDDKKNQILKDDKAFQKTLSEKSDNDKKNQILKDDNEINENKSDKSTLKENNDIFKNENDDFLEIPNQLKKNEEEKDEKETRTILAGIDTNVWRILLRDVNFKKVFFNTKNVGNSEDNALLPSLLSSDEDDTVFEQDYINTNISDISGLALEKLKWLLGDGRPLKLIGLEDEEKKKGGGLVSGLMGSLLSSLVGGASGGLMASMASALGISGKLLAFATNPITLFAAWLIWGAIDAIRGGEKAEEWGVDKMSAQLGGFIAGGEIAGLFGNAAKWASLGIAIGTAGGPIGMLAGGILGATFGVIANSIGAEKIAQGVYGLKTWALDQEARLYEDFYEKIGEEPPPIIKQRIIEAKLNRYKFELNELDNTMRTRKADKNGIVPMTNEEAQRIRKLNEEIEALEQEIQKKKPELVKKILIEKADRGTLTGEDYMLYPILSQAMWAEQTQQQAAGLFGAPYERPDRYWNDEAHKASGPMGHFNQMALDYRLTKDLIFDTRNKGIIQFQPDKKDTFETYESTGVFSKKGGALENAISGLKEAIENQLSHLSEMSKNLTKHLSEVSQNTLSMANTIPQLKQVTSGSLPTERKIPDGYIRDPIYEFRMKVREGLR